MGWGGCFKAVRVWHTSQSQRELSSKREALADVLWGGVGGAAEGKWIRSWWGGGPDPPSGEGP